MGRIVWFSGGVVAAGAGAPAAVVVAGVAAAIGAGTAVGYVLGKYGKNLFRRKT